MGEEKDGTKGISLGSLVLFAVVANLVTAWLGFSFPGIAIPFVVLAGLLYGEAQGFLVGFVGVVFAQLVLYSWGANMWLDAIVTGITSLFGKGGKESDFLVRVLLATVLLEILFQLNATGFRLSTDYYSGQWPFIALHFALNAIIAIILAINYLRPKDQ